MGSCVRGGSILCTARPGLNDGDSNVHHLAKGKLRSDFLILKIKKSIHSFTKVDHPQSTRRIKYGSKFNDITP